jgi:hypothetical protein
MTLSANDALDRMRSLSSTGRDKDIEAFSALAADIEHELVLRRQMMLVRLLWEQAGRQPWIKSFVVDPHATGKGVTIPIDAVEVDSALLRSCLADRLDWMRETIPELLREIEHPDPRFADADPEFHVPYVFSDWAESDRLWSFWASLGDDSPAARSDKIDLSSFESVAASLLDPPALAAWEAQRLREQVEAARPASPANTASASAMQPARADDAEGLDPARRSPRL